MHYFRTKSSEGSNFSGKRTDCHRSARINSGVSPSIHIQSRDDIPRRFPLPSSILNIDGLVTSYTKPPYGSWHQPFHDLLFLGNSKGNVYLIDLQQSSKSAMDTIKVVKVFKTNPVSQALHFSRQGPFEDDFLLVGGEMSDTILYHVIFILV
jgi:hypothetical protein